MKRCPQCLFIYPDSDSRCDFDNTPLVIADEAEIDAATTPSPSQTQGQAPTKTTPGKTASRKPKRLVVTALVVLAFFLITSVTYFTLRKRNGRKAQTVSTIGITAGRALSQPPLLVAPSPSPSGSPSPSPVEPPKPATPRIATAHSNTTVAPVSTSGPGMGKKLGGKPVILLSSGGKIEADEVWRTKDGVWYRRDGIVTLLKQGRVKAIVNQ
jgi:hypothetical protein